jgi:hypothetical protein
MVKLCELPWTSLNTEFSGSKATPFSVLDYPADVEALRWWDLSRESYAEVCDISGFRISSKWEQVRGHNP